jgi:hypothetical protein
LIRLKRLYRNFTRCREKVRVRYNYTYAEVRVPPTGHRRPTRVPWQQRHPPSSFPPSTSAPHLPVSAQRASDPDHRSGDPPARRPRGGPPGHAGCSGVPGGPRHRVRALDRRRAHAALIGRGASHRDLSSVSANTLSAAHHPRRSATTAAPLSGHLLCFGTRCPLGASVSIAMKDTLLLPRKERSRDRDSTSRQAVDGHWSSPSLCRCLSILVFRKCVLTLMSSKERKHFQKSTAERPLRN